MTKEKALMIIARHKHETYYSTNSFQIGDVTVTGVYEDGFTFTRKTEYIETQGIYEEYYETSDIFDINAYTMAEVVTKRFI